MDTGFQTCRISDVLNFKSDRAKGRIVVIMTIMFTSVASNLSSGIFFTNFLLELGIDIVQIGVLGFVASFASIFSVFSPYLLEKFKRRKWLLAGAKLLYYVFNILAINVLAAAKISSQRIYILLIICLFIANITNFLISGPGYMVWHFQFLEEKSKAKYFSIQQFVSAVMAAAALLTSGFVADSVGNSANKMEMMLTLRYVAFGIGLLDCLVLVLPKEFPYSGSTEKKSPIRMFFVAFKYKKFLLTILIACFWNFCVYIAQSAFDANLLSHIQVRYSLVTVINSSLCLFILIFSGYWTHKILKRSWLPTLRLAIVLYAGTVIGLSFITAENYIWLYTSMRLLQNFLTVGINITISNIPYLNLGEEDQTGCLSFYSFITNFFVLLGQMAGTFFISRTRGMSLFLWNCQYNNVTALLWIEAVLLILLGIYIFLVHSRFKQERQR